MDSLFLDTSYVIALAVERDTHHSRAVQLADRVEEENTRIVTTRPVVLEIGNYLSKPNRRPQVISYVETLEQEPAVEIVPLTKDLFRRGFELYRQRPDKTWGLTDCISFIVMRDQGIQEALTTDRDFEQAGFNALLGD